jgi:hypothetical protein
MPTPLTRNINIALSEEDYAAIETRARGCTPTETARELLLHALRVDPMAVTLLAELLVIRRVLLNGPGLLTTFEEIKVRDARKMLGCDTEE